MYQASSLGNFSGCSKASSTICFFSWFEILFQNLFTLGFRTKRPYYPSDSYRPYQSKKLLLLTSSSSRIAVTLSAESSTSRMISIFSGVVYLMIPRGIRSPSQSRFFNTRFFNGSSATNAFN